MNGLNESFLKQPGGRGSQVRLEFGQSVEAGSEGKKSFAAATVVGVRGKERHGGQFFVKYEIGRHGDSDPERVVRKYKWLKERGFPVVPTLRFDRKSNSLLMTDLTAGSKKIVIDWHYSIHRHRITLDQISNWDDIKQSVKEIARRAYVEGMALSDENYAVVLEKRDGRYYGKVYLIDLGYGAFWLAERSGTRLLNNQIQDAEKFLGEIFLDD